MTSQAVKITFFEPINPEQEKKLVSLFQGIQNTLISQATSSAFITRIYGYIPIGSIKGVMRAMNLKFSQVKENPGKYLFFGKLKDGEYVFEVSDELNLEAPIKKDVVAAIMLTVNSKKFADEIMRDLKVKGLKIEQVITEKPKDKVEPSV